MNDFADTPDRDPNPPDPPVYCDGAACGECRVPLSRCPGTAPEEER